MLTIFASSGVKHTHSKCDTQCSLHPRTPLVTPLCICRVQNLLILKERSSLLGNTSLGAILYSQTELPPIFPGKALTAFKRSHDMQFFFCNADMQQWGREKCPICCTLCHRAAD